MKLIILIVLVVSMASAATSYGADLAASSSTVYKSGWFKYFEFSPQDSGNPPTSFVVNPSYDLQFQGGINADMSQEDEFIWHSGTYMYSESVFEINVLRGAEDLPIQLN